MTEPFLDTEPKQVQDWTPVPEISDLVDMTRFHELQCWPGVDARGHFIVFWPGVGTIKLQKHADGNWTRLW